MCRFNPSNHNKIVCVDVEQRNVCFYNVMPDYNEYQVHQEGYDLSNEASSDEINASI